MIKPAARVSLVFLSIKIRLPVERLNKGRSITQKTLSLGNIVKISICSSTLFLNWTMLSFFLICSCTDSSFKRTKLWRGMDAKTHFASSGRTVACLMKQKDQVCAIMTLKNIFAAQNWGLFSAKYFACNARES